MGSKALEGHKHIMKNFTAEITAEKYLNILTQIFLNLKVLNNSSQIFLNKFSPLQYLLNLLN